MYIHFSALLCALANAAPAIGAPGVNPVVARYQPGGSAFVVRDGAVRHVVRDVAARDVSPVAGDMLGKRNECTVVDDVIKVLKVVRVERYWPILTLFSFS
jgi:hypothetical protein